MLWSIYNGSIVGILEKYSSYVFATQFADVGECEIIAPYNSDNMNLLHVGSVLSRDEDRKNNWFKNCFIIRSQTIEYDVERGYMIRARGRGLKDLLSQRIVWTRKTFENENVETVVRTIVDENMVTTSNVRVMPNFSITGALAGLTATGTFQLFGENLAEWLTSVAKEYGFGWDVCFDGFGDYVFEIIKSTDRTRGQSDVDPVVFSEDLDNIISFESNFSREFYKNAALVGGEGEGASKKTASVGNLPSAIGENRFEEYIDGSSVSSDGEIITEQTYLNMLKQYGQSELESHSKLRSFTAEVNTERPYKLGRDFFLGDKVEVDTRFYSATPRVVEVTYSEDVNGKQTNATFEF